MAKFIFKMQSILDIKFRLEDQAKTAYGEARARLNKEEEILEKLEDKKSYYEERTRSLISYSEEKEKKDQIVFDEKDTMVISPKLNIKDIITCENGIETIKYHIKVQKIRIKQAEHELETAREKLNKAMIERKTYEKLKENAFEDFKKEIEAEEQKEIDELVSFKFNNTTVSEEERYGKEEERTTI